MHARVARQLGMERSGEDASLAHEDGLALEPPEHLHARAGVGDPRGPDEDSSERLRIPLELDVRLEARDLPAVSVALDLQVDQPEMRAIEEDHARAGSEQRARECGHRLLEAADAHEAADRGRLTPRDDEPVEPRQLLRPADFHDVDAEPTQQGHVLAKVPLDRQDADAQRVAHSRETVPPGPSAPGPRLRRYTRNCHGRVTVERRFCADWRLPAARLEQLLRREGGGVQAAHRLAEAGGDARERLGVGVVRRRLDDRLRPRERVGST